MSALLYSGSIQNQRATATPHSRSNRNPGSSICPARAASASSFLTKSAAPSTRPVKLGGGDHSAPGSSFGRKRSTSYTSSSPAWNTRQSPQPLAARNARKSATARSVRPRAGGSSGVSPLSARPP